MHKDSLLSFLLLSLIRAVFLLSFSSFARLVCDVNANEFQKSNYHLDKVKKRTAKFCINFYPRKKELHEILLIRSSNFTLKHTKLENSTSTTSSCCYFCFDLHSLAVRPQLSITQCFALHTLVVARFLWGRRRNADERENQLILDKHGEISRITQLRFNLPIIEMTLNYRQPLNWSAVESDLINQFRNILHKFPVQTEHL